MDKKAYIFVGPQGSGKNTQFTLLRERLEERGLKVFVITTGDKLRSFMGNGGYTEDFVRESMNRGDLQPDFIVSHVVLNAFIGNYKGEEMVMFEGFPRKFLQAELLDQMLDYYGLAPEVILLEVPREVTVKRLMARGREDDTMEAINHRLDQYEREIGAVLDFFKEKKYPIHTIDAERSVEEIQQDIIGSLSLN